MASEPENLQHFERIWQSPPGFWGALAVVNNQPLGKRFLVTAVIFFLIGGVLALLMRTQLAVSGNTFLGPQMYNQLFTMHGSTMMYLFAVPFLEGLAIYLLPLMLGSRDLPFPRATAFGYWTYLFGGVIFYLSFAFGRVPDSGWFSYVPLAGPHYAHLGQDFWLLGLALVEISGLTAGVELVVLVLKLRAAGMALNRLPLFAWAMLTVGVMILFAFPPLLVLTALLELDRSVGTHFFNPQAGGHSLLWQHLFWFFGHPEVYIMFIPATGMVSMVVIAFARRIIGYVWIVVAIIVTGFVSFGLWVHHMFATGLPELSFALFTAASLMIALASGTQIFAWIASLWGTRPAMKTPLLFVLGFFFIFVLGGLTGVMIAVVPFNWQVHDTFFIVAHFHYVLIGGVIFPAVAGLYYWLPKMTGRMLSERLGQAVFWLTFLGFNVTFFPMHLMGFWGLPRRVYTYPEELQLDGYNLLATGGAFTLGLGFALLAVDFLLSLRRAPDAGKNPWQGDTLEWTVSSPPPVFGHLTPPTVRSLHPAWDQAESPTTPGPLAALTAAPRDWRATLVTNGVTGEPQAVQYLPGPSYLPLITALGLTVALVGVLAKTYLLFPLGMAFTVGALVSWLWPKKHVADLLRESSIAAETGLTVYPSGPRSVNWWGTVCLLAILATGVGTLLFAYFYTRLFSDSWPQGGIPRPGLMLASILAGVLLVSAAVQYAAQRSFRAGRLLWLRVALAINLVLGLFWLGLLFFEQCRLSFMPTTNAYGSLFYVLGWTLGILVAVGLGLIVAMLLRLGGAQQLEIEPLAVQMEITTLLWSATVVLGLVILATLYATPHLL